MNKTNRELDAENQRHAGAFGYFCVMTKEEASDAGFSVRSSSDCVAMLKFVTFDGEWHTSTTTGLPDKNYIAYCKDKIISTMHRGYSLDAYDDITPEQMKTIESESAGAAEAVVAADTSARGVGQHLGASDALG